MMRNFLLAGMLLSAMIACDKDCPECTTPLPEFRFNFVDQNNVNLVDPDNPGFLQPVSVTSSFGDTYAFVHTQIYGNDTSEWFLLLTDVEFYERSEAGEEIEVAFDSGDSETFYVESEWNSVETDDDCSCSVQEYDEVIYDGEHYEMENSAGIHSFRLK